MNKRLQNDLDSIFSLLPNRKAEQAKKDLLERLASDGTADADELKWAEFDSNGRFLRGGITVISEFTTHVIANSQEDPEVHDLVRRVSDGGIEPGLMEWAPASGRLHWYVPFMPTRADKVLGKRVRGLSLSFPLFRDILRMFNDGLTAKEWRVVFQVVAGISLRDAALGDDVSYETKRAHVKSACEKLRCTGQKELMQKIVGQLAYLFSLSDGEASHADVAESFVSRYLANDARLTVKRLADGRLVRFLECGPSDGTPVVMIHGIMFPISLYGISEHLDAAGIRLIVPIRQGFLESRSVSALFKVEDLLDSSMEDIALLLEHVCATPAVVLGNSLGALVAVRFANRYPELVSHLVLLSINLTQTTPSDKNYAGDFYGGLRNISDRPELFRFVNWHFKKYYADESTCREILLRLFGDSNADREVLEGRFSRVPAYPIFSETYQTSTVGIAEDFRLSTESWKSDFDRLSMPVTFIHGDRDPLTKVAELAAFVFPGSRHRIVEVPDGGHFISVSHANQVWRDISNLAAGTAVRRS
jgi:pimeloyl-ACP methyl ester carboxylesterase/DNA-binding CsgD family transcriptional regulator